MNHRVVYTTPNYELPRRIAVCTVVVMRIENGKSLGRDLTVLGQVDGHRTPPVYLVWNHRAWCPMACKLYKSLAYAEHEAAVLRSFEHPGIVRCLGTGLPGYLLMEFLEGPTLNRFMRSKRAGRLSTSDALRVAIYLGSALVHMHARGFLHLDVKPANVIVFRGRPVLFDLDIARRIDGPPPAGISGTASYMSPEQCRRETPTPASDVFGLGVTLFQMLTAKTPFPEGRGRTAYPQMRVDATPLSRYLPRASKGLEDWLQRCLMRNPAERPTLEALLPALHGFIATGPRMWPAGFEPGRSARPVAARRIRQR